MPAKTPKRCIKVLFSKQILYTGYLYTAIISTGVSSAIWKNKHLSVFQRPQVAVVLQTRAVLIAVEKLART